jgi:kinesin family protein C1
MRGIIPRAVEKILTEAKAMHNQKWKFSLSASFLEIYNEDLKDLLLDMSGDKSFSQNPPKLAIKRNSEGKGYVENLTEISIETTDTPIGLQQLDALMSVAARSRSVASTKMNAQSSRSHSVFILNLRGYNIEDGTEVQGSLNLCDLAGSERLDRSGAHNDAKRLRETQAINKSLSCLGDVFNALATKASHVPYRNSKLTYLLQDCLSGDGKALMFVNLSPTNASSNESLCSLRFAQRVNQVELGKATKHIQYRR